MKKYSFLIICTLLTGLLFTTCEPWIVPEAVFVNFNANGGQGDMKAQRFMDGEKQNLELNSFTRKYYNFAGWNTRADGKGLTYQNGQIVSLNKSCILYAQWERITYSLTFNANGGKGTMNPQTFEEGVSQAIAANTFTRDGYAFAGWNTKADGSGTSYTNKHYISLKQDMTLYAQWERKGFILTFNANGGTGTMDPQTFEEGVSQAIKANTFTRDGYTFAGWNSAANGSGPSYTDMQTITLKQDMTLYAQWELFTPTYVDLGLSVKWANCNVGATFPEGYGDYFAWGETSPKDDYSWSTYKYCNGSSSTLTKYNTNSSNGTVDNKTTLELSDDAARVNWGGNWRIPTRTEQDELRNNCTWTWITQNGVDGYKVTSKTNGNSIFLPAAGYRSGTSVYDVGSDGDYWSSSLDESSPGFACYLCFSLGNVDWFYNLRREGRPVRAVCGNNTAAQTFTLTFNANGGTGTMAAQTFEAGVSQALAANAFTRSGYTFTGWNTNADGSGTAYTDKQSITLSQNITLYAQWKRLFKVFFNANGGTGTMAAQTFVAGVSQTIAANTFTRSGYTFTGWNTNADGSGTSYTDKQSITLSQYITLYAQWKNDIVNYTVTFNANGGTGTMAEQTFVAGVSQAIKANTFTRSGYTFTGWNTNAGGSGTSYTDKQSIILSQNITLYAQWEQEQEQVVSGTENGHDYVDLGLPSGLKWATCNVGATTPDGYGDYFAWGETSPKSNYAWSTYKYRNGSYSTLTKYNTNSSSGTVDNKTTLDLSDDAARANWGGEWRMPTYNEWNELKNSCTWTWSSTQNGIKGYKVTSKTNGNSIFLPAAGYRNGTSVNQVGSYGEYWSSSLYESDSYQALILGFHPGSVGWYHGGRELGYTVRAVCP